MNLVRLWTIAKNVFWEVMRDRILYIIGIFALIMVGAARLLPEVSAATEDKITLDVGIAAMSVLALVVTVFVSTALVNQEIEKRTVYLLVAKPMSRPELIIGKHLGLSAVLGILVAAMTLIYMAVLSFNQIPYPVGSLVVASLFLWLQLSLISAVGILFGVFTSSLLATLLTFGVYVMGSLSRDLLQLGKLSENPAIEQMMTGLYIILPDLARLDLKNDAVYGILPPLSTLITNVGYGLIYTILLLSISIAVFWRREF